MTQTAVSVVIPVWNEWNFTRACLDTLRPTLGIRDEVIVVDNGSEDYTSQGLKQFPWIKVITNDTNRGFGIACNQGAAAASNEIVIFLNNDTLLPSRWIDGLIAPFEDQTVVATGPRSNMVSGPQWGSQVGYRDANLPDMKRFAKQWREEHRGQFDEVKRLVGFCIAVRKSAFDAVGGFDEEFVTGGAEDDELCIRLRNAGGRLLICNESFVHHFGHATFEGNGLDWTDYQDANLDRFAKKHGAKIPLRPDKAPLLSACMITKDEEGFLESCLKSIARLVDEIVIYDTGSTDRTIEIARAAGATVVEGYWDDDFGRARNASLDHCSGDWVLHIDADEIFEGDAQAIRRTLQSAPISAFQIDILNLSGGSTKTDLVHRPCRIFKRELFHWVGRLHEQVTFRDGVFRDDFGILTDGRLIHSGYTAEVMTSKNKAERNIRIAKADADADDDRDPMDKLTNLGRSYTLASRFEEALVLYEKARTHPILSPVTARTLYRAGAQTCIALDRPDEALDWVEELSRLSECQDGSRFLRASAYMCLGRWRDAVEELEAIVEMKDDDGVVFPKFLINSNRGKCYIALEQFDRAADAFAEVAHEDASDEPIWTFVAEAYYRAGRDLHELLRTISSEKVNAIFGQLVNATPEAADHMLDALYDDVERRPSVLALAIRVAPKLPAHRCLEWSARLRSVGMTEHCPLIARANARDAEAVEALRCAAVAYASFGDERALKAIELIAPTVAMDEFEEALTVIDEIEPALLGALILSASNTAERCFDIARILRDLGAEDQAVAVVLHGRSLPTGGKIAADAAAWLESFGRVEEAAVMRSGSSI
jgi:GT2 family glycosyltransferase/tetratricopeptide (TPR) repeat protein